MKIVRKINVKESMDIVQNVILDGIHMMMKVFFALHVIPIVLRKHVQQRMEHVHNVYKDIIHIQKMNESVLNVMRIV